jgi:hypothetical protein
MSRLDEAFKNKPIFMPLFPVGLPGYSHLGGRDRGAREERCGRNRSRPVFLRPPWPMDPSSSTPPRWRWNRAYNPILSYGLARFVKDAQAAGADGFIVPDLPYEESRRIQGGARGSTVDSHAGTDLAGRAYGNHRAQRQGLYLPGQRHRYYRVSARIFRLGWPSWWRACARTPPRRSASASASARLNRPKPSAPSRTGPSSARPASAPSARARRRSRRRALSRRVSRRR